MSAELEPQEQINRAFDAGKTAFERGRYQESVTQLSQAAGLVNLNSGLGGEIQIWLVTAYDAAGQREAAIALCRQLHHHPDRDTRQQSRRLLYILEAPQLRRRPEWLTQIPDLGEIKDQRLDAPKGTAAASPRRSPRPAAQSEPVDLSQVNTQDNGFVWLALVAIAMVLGALLWFSASHP